MPYISGSEKELTVVGRGINVLTASGPKTSHLKTYKIFDMSKVTVEYTTDNETELKVKTENSLIELAKSLSISAGIEGKYMAFSASLKTDYKSSEESSTEKAYTRVNTIIKKKVHYLSDNTTYKKYQTESFKRDLNGSMSPKEFFSNYGTHFIREAGIGGSMMINLITTKEKNESKESLQIEAKASYAKMLEASVTTKTETSVKKLLDRSEFSFSAVGGKNVSSLTINNMTAEYPSWVKSVEDNPSKWAFCYWPSDNSLVPLWTLCTNATRRKELIDYFDIEAAKLETSLEKIDTFVSDIIIQNESRKPNARALPYPDWRLVDQDLNEGAKGNFIYITYKTMTKGELERNGKLPITNLLLVMSDKQLKWKTARLADGNNKVATYYRYDSDLNKSAGGKYIYLCYTYDKNYAPLTAIDAYKDNNLPGSKEWGTVTWNNSHAIADANRGAGGRYIYILQKHRQ